MLYKQQYGFRRKVGTVDALVSVVKHTFLSFNNTMNCVGFLLGLKKYFDTVNHQILRKKCEKNFEIGGIALDWSERYLRDRRQVLKISKTISIKFEIGCGVPPGSVLELLLFIVYIFDLHLYCPGTKIIMFADDTRLLFGVRDLSISTID